MVRSWKPPFVFTHKPAVSDDGYVIRGHVHPAARLTGPGRETVRLPCFWARPRTLVLPAFGEFTGVAEIEVEPNDRVWVVAGAAVLDVSAGVSRGVSGVRALDPTGSRALTPLKRPLKLVESHESFSGRSLPSTANAPVR